MEKAQPCFTESPTLLPGSLHLELTKKRFPCLETTDWKGPGHLQVVCPQRWVGDALIWGVSMVPDHVSDHHQHYLEVSRASRGHLGSLSPSSDLCYECL